MASGGQQAIEFESEVGGGVVAVQQYFVSAADPGIYEIAICSTVFVDSLYTMGACDFLNLGVSSDPDSMGVSALSALELPDGSRLTLYEPGLITVQDYDFPAYVAMGAASFDSIPSVGEPNDSLYGGPAQALGTLTVSGRYVYWVETVNNQHVYAPLVNATVFIMDSDTGCGDDEELGRTATNSQGYFPLSVGNGDCTGTADVYARAQLDNSHLHVSDRSLSGGAVGYKFKTDTHPDAGSGTLNLGTFIAGGNGSSYEQRACFAFDSLNRAWLGLFARGYSMFELRAWYGSYLRYLVDDGSGDVHTFYDDEAQDIVLGDPLAADYFDIVVHEYGHAVQDMFGDAVQGTACGNEHNFGQIINDRCAWEEGFADFFPLIIEEDGWLDGWNGHHSFERIPDDWETLTSTNALKIEDAVARALYDLYDQHVDDAPRPWYRGQDNYSNLANILDVLQDHTVQNSFSVFWSKWVQAGKPKHLPVQAIRLNQINFNTVPQWLVPISNRMVGTGLADTLNIAQNIYDQQSSDSELNFGVQSNSNPQVTLSWISPGILRAVFNGTSGFTDVRLSAYDGISATASNLFRIQWVVGGGKGEEPPPDPCDGACPIAGFTPQVTDLGPAWPNPFNPSTEFFYDLDSQSNVLLAIYNVSGQRVRTIVDRQQNTGRYSAKWNGANDHGVVQPSGVYFIVLRANGRQFSSKVVLLK